MRSPALFWFFDRVKSKTERGDKVLFIDARHLYRQIDRAHRDWLPEQIEFLTNVRLYRSEAIEPDQGSEPLLAEKGLSEGYTDMPGLCTVSTRGEIEKQGWSLNPWRYVGAAEREAEDVDFSERLEQLAEEMEVLNFEAR